MRRLQAAVAGVAAVGAALGVTELVAVLVDGVPSLVSAVGSLVIPFTPPWLKDWAVATFGTSDKAVLTGGVAIVTLGIGALAGVQGLSGRRRPAVLVGTFTVVGLAAALAQPLAATVPTVVMSALAGGTTWLVLTSAWRLLTDRPAEHPEPAEAPGLGDPTNPDVPRRNFLALVGGTGVVAVAATVGARALRPSEATRAAPPVSLPSPNRSLPPPAPATSLGVAGLTPIHVPNGDFYRIDTALTVPRIDVSRWRLRIHGMVDRELELTYAELLDRSYAEQDVTIACVSNEVGGRLVGNARWLGTSLPDLLEEAGVHEGATQVVGRALDGWTAGFPTQAALDGRGAMVAVGMNGEPLPRDHGFPARLIVPGLYGYVSATKWLTEIELATLEAFDAYWVPRGWAKQAPIKTQSRIDVPRDRATVAPGQVTVAGVAWAPTRGIQRVEVQVNDGVWNKAEVSEPLSADAWVQWRTTVDVPPGDHRVRVRATDGGGMTQPSQPVPPRPDGAEGWHTIRLSA